MEDRGIVFRFNYDSLKNALGDVSFEQLDLVEFKNGNRPFKSIEYKVNNN